MLIFLYPEFDAHVKHVFFHFKTIRKIKSFPSIVFLSNVLHIFILTTIIHHTEVSIRAPFIASSWFKMLQLDSLQEQKRANIPPLCSSLCTVPVRQHIDFKCLSLNFKALNNLATKCISSQVNSRFISIAYLKQPQFTKEISI